MGTSVEIAGEAAEGRGAVARSEDRWVYVSLLGQLAVHADGHAMELPRSRKCRALLAYLAATGKPHRREHLCELLWELPDDPRGSLRWSLSKLRRVLGDSLVAGRETVALDPNCTKVDLDALRSAAARAGSLPLGELQQIGGKAGEPFAPDVDLPRCSEFESWLAGTREDVRRAQLAILTELVGRLSQEPEQALPFARSRVALDPLDEQARIGLLATLEAAGRHEEAERQRGIAVGVLTEAGIAVPAALAGRSRKAATPSQGSPLPVQRIQFCTAPDGTRLAYSSVGEGPTILKTANWMSHLEHEWESPFLRHWLEELSRARRLVRYDARGNGLSDRRAKDLSLDAFVQDLEAVAARLPDEPLDLLGISQGCTVAIAFAVRHPQRVRRLVLFGGFATGWRKSNLPEVHARWEAMITLAGQGWGNNNPAFRQLFTSLFAPRAAPDHADAFNELQRVSATPETAQRLLRAMGELDVWPLLPLVQAPTLVLHCREDALVPFSAGRALATHIPGAEFVALDSDNHLPFESEPAWAVLVERMREFLAR